MNDGYDRESFSNFMADYKRANRHMLHTCKLAEQNGIAPEALASVCLEVAAELMTHSNGSQVALENLQLTVDRISKDHMHERQLQSQFSDNLN